MEGEDEQIEENLYAAVESIRCAVHWPVGRRLSAWYFLTGSGLRVHLKHGWNMFGRRSCNHIEIRDPEMKSTEFFINVLGNKFLLVVYDVNGNTLVNGRRMNRQSRMLPHGSRIGVVVGNTKVISFEFRNKL